MSDLKLEIVSIPDPTGTFSNHSNIYVASFNSGTGELVFCIIADPFAVSP